MIFNLLNAEEEAAALTVLLPRLSFREDLDQHCSCRIHSDRLKVFLTDDRNSGTNQNSVLTSVHRFCLRMWAYVFAGEICLEFFYSVILTVAHLITRCCVSFTSKCRFWLYSCTSF